MRRQFQNYTDRIAIVSEGKKYDFQTLNQEVLDKLDRISRYNIAKGETVLLLGDYSFEAISWLIALYENKNIVVPVTTSVQTEIDERIEEAHVDVIVDLRQDKVIRTNNTREKHDFIRNLQTNNNSGLVIFSSGSTGRPKAMVHNMDQLISVYLNKRPRKVTFLVFLMFDHIGGLNTLFNCLSTGATIVIPAKREPEEICRLIEDFKINILPTSPTFLNLMLMSGCINNYDLSSLRMITYGTEAMPESLLIRLKVAFKRVKFLQTFGTSETGIIKTTSQSSSSTFIKLEDPDQEHKIVNGELWLRSKTQIMGYMNHSMENFTKDGWFKTGDIVEKEGDYIRIKGRLKEVINVGGEKVLPIEIEGTLLSHPDVIDCTVYGEENLITGQTVVANVRILEGSDKKDVRKKLRAYCKTKLEPYKVPTKFNFVSNTDYTERFKKSRP